MDQFKQQEYRDKILFLLRNDKEVIAKEMIKKIAREKFLVNEDTQGLYNFFSPLYDELFFEISFKIALYVSVPLMGIIILNLLLKTFSNGNT